MQIVKEIAHAHESKIAEYLASFYDTEKFSDVTLYVGASKISAHRMVLAGIREIYLNFNII